MAPPTAYLPANTFPNLTGAAVGGVPTILLQGPGDQLLWYETWRNDYTIATASNTTPIKLTFSSSIAGKIVTGSSVFVQGVSGSSTVNGFWGAVTIVDGTSLTLDGSTAGGAGTGGQAFEASLGLLSKLIDAANYLGVRLLGTAYSTGPISTQGRKSFARPRVAVGSSGGTFGVADGDVFELDPNPGGSAVIILDDTTPTPIDGETLLFVAPGLGNTNPYQFQRADTTVVAGIYGTALGNTCPSACFEFAGGVWRLGSNSGWVQAETQGVLAGSGA